MPTVTLGWRIQPGDSLGSVFDSGAFPFKVCEGTIQAHDGPIDLSTQDGGQVYLRLEPGERHPVNGHDLRGLTAAQGIAGGTANLSFYGSVHQ